MNRTIKGAGLRATWLVCALVAALQAPLSWGLGLGEIEVSSRLNEKFEASIPINSESRVDGSRLIISLASAEEFRRMGIDRPYMLTRLKFEMRYANGRNFIQITSPDVLREPFLSFLIEARWPSGRMLKEYTVLLDLPDTRNDAIVDEVVENEPPASVNPDTSISSVVAPARKAAPAPSRPSARVPSGSSAASLLPKLASTPNSSSAQTSSQTVAAPVVAEPTQAVSQVTDTDTTQTQPAPGNVVNSTAEEALQSNARIDNEVAVLQTELAKSLENLDKAELENEELEQRIEVVESQVDDFEKLVSLKNEELDAVRDSIEEKQALLQAQTDPTQVTDDTGAASSAEASAISTSSPLAASVSADSSATTAKSVGFAGLSYSMIVLLAGGLAVLLLLIVLVMRAFSGGNRQSANTSTVFDVDNDEQPSFDGVTAAQTNFDESDTAVNVADQVDTPEISDATDLDAIPDEAIVGLAEHNIADTSNTGAGFSDSGADSAEEPIADADIYMTYGRHEQAISALKRAIDTEPDRADLRLKLLEVIHDQGTLDENTYLVESQKQHILEIDSGLASEIQEIIGDSDSPAGLGGDDESLSLDVELDDTLELSATETDAEPVQGTDEDSADVDDSELAEEVQTKLELASTYFEMGDFNGARDILQEIMEEGSPEQQGEAQQLLKKLA